ncbi:ATP-binding protein [Acidovorax sp.]|uniref:ATP-binding protein n=1 Tax=Acidovorax sp. TaxID=1872122 RepID=UPI002620A30B|nr:ATP-binding protein [Acidovorax sp.]
MSNAWPHRWMRWWPDSLASRLLLIMVCGVVLSQTLALGIWSAQLQASSRLEARQTAELIAHGAASAVRFYSTLPVQYRPLVVQQMRAMGGARFFVNLNRGMVPITPLPAEQLTDIITAEVVRTLQGDLPGMAAHAVFAQADTVPVTDDGKLLSQMPESWVEGASLLLPRPAPLLVIQVEFEPGGWLQLVSTMPDPYFLESARTWTWDRLLAQAMTLVTVLALGLALMRSLTRPLRRLAQAARAFGSGLMSEPVPEVGSGELRETARAFNDMQARVQQVVEEREHFYRGISHDLKTPIMRMKLATELLDDELVRTELHEELDELDMMVKAALQNMRDTDIHENLSHVRLVRLVERLTSSAISSGTPITLDVPDIGVTAKPLALKRALANVLDNAVRYGRKVHVSAEQNAEWVTIRVRDHGPGLPEDALETVFEPYVRMEHARQAYSEGSGLGLNIARSIVQAHGGHVSAANHPEGGLVVTLSLPA